MNITLGVFDLFTYIAPGSLYLALVLYIAERLSWIDLSRLLQSNTAILIISGAVVSYLLGHITYHAGYLLTLAYRKYKHLNDARREFEERVPAAKGRPFLQAPRSVVLAAIELHNFEASTEVSRLRAVGLMLRNCG